MQQPYYWVALGVSLPMLQKGIDLVQQQMLEQLDALQ
jgi:hypothetical protein